MTKAPEAASKGVTATKTRVNFHPCANPTTNPATNTFEKKKKILKL